MKKTDVGPLAPMQLGEGVFWVKNPANKRIAYIAVASHTTNPFTETWWTVATTTNSDYAKWSDNAPSSGNTPATLTFVYSGGYSPTPPSVTNVTFQQWSHVVTRP